MTPLPQEQQKAVAEALRAFADDIERGDVELTEVSYESYAWECLDRKWAPQWQVVCPPPEEKMNIEFFRRRITVQGPDIEDDTVQQLQRGLFT